MRHVHGSLEYVRVNGGHSVDSVRAHDGQVGHVQPLIGDLLYDRHAPDARLVSWEPFCHSLLHTDTQEIHSHNYMYIHCILKNKQKTFTFSLSY